MPDHFNTRITLISRLRDQQDDDAWNDFVFFYQKYIHAVIYRLGVQNNEVEDLTQTVMLALWKGLPEFDYQPNRCKFRTWMSRIIRNHVGHYFQKQKRYSNDRQRVESMRLNEDQTNDPEVYNIAEHEWKLHVAKLAWAKVQKEFSGKVLDCFELFADGLSAVQIAEKLEIKTNTAFVYRQRVQESFHREIRHLDEELS